MKFSYKVLSSAAVAGIIASIPMVAHAANGDFYNQTKKLQYSRADLLASKDLQKTLQAQLDAQDVIIKDLGTSGYVDYQKASASFLNNYQNTHNVQDAISKALVEGKITPADDVTKYLIVKPLAVNSVSNITKTSLQVKLATGVNQDAAKLAANYAVKNGDADVTVSKVDYNSALNVATITADLDGKDGKLTVNGVSSDSFDFKAPTISKITPISLTQFKVEFNEALNAASVDSATYAVANGADIVNVSAKLGTDNKTIYFTADAKLTAGTTYTFGVKGIKDTALNEAKDQITTSFTAAEDTVAPTIGTVKALDSDKIEITMSEPVIATEAISAKFAAYGVDGKLGDLKTGTPKITQEGTLADGKTAFGTKIVVSVADADLLENGTNYNIVLSGVKDLSGLSIADKANADFVGVRDVVPPTVASSTYKDGKLSITFSEEVSGADVTTNYKVYNKNTGEEVGSPSLKPEVQDDKVTYVLDLSSLKLAYNTDYSVVLNNIKDIANVPNVLKANTLVEFKTPQESLKSTEVGTATPAYDSTSKTSTVALTFSNAITKTEAENVANYSIAKTDDATVTLAVTKAVLSGDGKTVTLTTALQDGANYTIKVLNISNLASDKNTVKFDSKDVIAPVFNEAKVVNSKVVDLTFSEAVKTYAAITVVKSGEAISVTPKDIVQSADKKSIRLTFADDALTTGATYNVLVKSAADEVGNATEKQTKTFVAGAADTTPAKLTGVKVDSSTQIQLQFDEALDETAIPVASNLALTVAGKGVDLTTDAMATKIDVKGSVVTVSTAASMFKNGDSATVKVTGGVKDLAGNTTTDSSAAFTGVVDSVGPSLVSAAAGKTDDTVVLTFDKALGQVNNVGDKITLDGSEFIVSNPDTFESLSVTGASFDEKDSKVINVKVSGMKSGVTYKVYVAGASKIVNTEVGANQGDIANQNRTATFTGIDTTAPTLSDLKIAGADTSIDEKTNTIKIDLLAGTTSLSAGSVKLSEDVKATLDAKNDSYDIVNPVTVTTADADNVVKLVSGIYGKDGVSAKTLIDNSGSTLTLKDAAGNATVYTITVTQK